jgi:competence protein ComEC
VHYTAIIPIWKSSPFIRLLLPLVAGILLQWIFSFGLASLLIVLLLSIFLPFLFFRMSIARQFQVHAFRGILINLFIGTLGMLVTWQKDSRHSATWFGHRDCDSSLLLVKINEPLVDKPKSFKAEAMVEAIIRGNSITRCSGQILVYFSKDSCSKLLAYGDLVLIRKKLQPIKNSGNPGAFNYERCLHKRMVQIQYEAFSSRPEKASSQFFKTKLQVKTN